MRCSICGTPLGDDAVTFTAGNVVLFRPCADCETQARQVVHAGAVLGGRKLKAKLEELVPNAKEVFAAARKALRVAQVVTEQED